MADAIDWGGPRAHLIGGFLILTIGAEEIAQNDVFEAGKSQLLWHREYYDDMRGGGSAAAPHISIIFMKIIRIFAYYSRIIRVCC